eukprot:GHUV01019502.1.p1 GENE.GHUV01019502.1~~GHUV01019502.1.p1  ORF type:complete len:143 (-),score=40.59 GHUV01019502.1:77-505(-)
MLYKAVWGHTMQCCLSVLESSKPQIVCFVGCIMNVLTCALGLRPALPWRSVFIALWLLLVQALQRELNKATGLELQHMRDRKHVFKKGRVGSTNSSGPEQKQQRRQEPSKWQGDGKAAAGAGSKAKQTTKLSFVVDEEEEEQ